MPDLAKVVGRRTFLRDLGHGAVALAVIWLAGCTRRGSQSSGASQSFDPLIYEGNLDEIEAFWCQENDARSEVPSQGAADPTAPQHPLWAQVAFSWAAAYVLVRGGEATVIDTAPWCEQDVIGPALRQVGVDWPAVASVVVTHQHPDHWVGLPQALERAPEAVVFAGAADIPHIASPRPIVAVGAGDRVMGLAIIPTPGHTPGHIAVHDDVAGVLVAGDAVGLQDGKVVLLPTTEDDEGAKASIRTLIGLSFDTLLLSHGGPIIGEGWEAMNEYLAGG